MHRPEKWGYVQFTRKRFGKAKLASDPAMKVRNVLQEIYYAERDYEANNHHWATSLDELRLYATLSRSLTKAPTLQMAKDGFEATAEIKLPDGRIERWHIRQDARVWKE